MSPLPRRRPIHLVVGVVTLVMAVSVGIQPGEAAPAPVPSLATSPVSLSATLDALPSAVNPENNLQPNTVRLLRLLEQVFPYYRQSGAIYGWREDPIPDHPSGQALDIMLADDGRTPESVAAGNLVNGFLMLNAETLGIDYMVYRQHIWYPGREWRLMDDRGNWTDNHMNHIHVLVHGSHTPSGSLRMPADLGGLSNPTQEALARAWKQTVARLERKVAHAKRELAAANQAYNTTMTRLKAVEASAVDAHRVMGSLAREAYMLGSDVALAASVAPLNDGPQSAAMTALVLDREHGRRSRIAQQAERQFQALPGLLEAARQERDNAQAVLVSVEAELQQVQATVKVIN